MNCKSLPYVAMLLAAVAVPAMTTGSFAQTTPAPAASAPAASAPAPAPMAAPVAAPTTPAPSAEPALPHDVSVKVEKHIKQMHAQLGITAAEEPQWEQFAQVMRDNAAQIDEAFTNRGSKVTAMNAADNMQSYAQVAQVHATNMQKLASAFQSLYNSFPDQQKQVADAVFRKSNGMPMHHKK